MIFFTTTAVTPATTATTTAVETEAMTIFRFRRARRSVSRRSSSFRFAASRRSSLVVTRVDPPESRHLVPSQLYSIVVPTICADVTYSRGKCASCT